MFSILMTSLTDKPLILQGEVWLRSLLGLKGLIIYDNLFAELSLKFVFQNKVVRYYNYSYNIIILL